MTAKPPNTSGLTPAPQSETLVRPTFDKILDSSGKLVANNGITFDTMLKLEGTAIANTELWIRDRTHHLNNVFSGSSGAWIKELDFSNQPFKRFSLGVIERYAPQNYSEPPYSFVLATETPIITKVTGKNGPINDGDTYNGDSLEFTGHAPPNMEVEALDGDTPTGKKETVNADGLFRLTFDGLTPGTYAVKIRAANDKESSVFTFKVALDVALSLDDVVDSKGSITEGGTTYEDKVTVNGYASPGEEVRLRNNDTPIDGATATARADDGFWEIELDVPPGLYSLTVEALYGDGEISTPPRTFTVALDVELSLDDVADSKGPIPGDGTTYEDKVTVNGFARPGEEVQLLNNGNPIDGATTIAGTDGAWEIDLDVTPGSYSLTAGALGEVTAPPRTFTVALDVELSLDDVADSTGSIPGDGTTYEDKVTVNGFARPGGEVQLLNNGNPIDGATTTAGLDGAWEIDLDVTPGAYSLTARALGEVTKVPRTFTVALDVELSLDDVLESEDGPSVPEDGTTDKNKLIIKGHARPGESIQLLNNGNPIKDATASADPDDGAWQILLDVTDGDYSLAAEANYGENEITAPPRTFTVASTIKPHNTRVHDSDGLIEDNGTTPYNYVIVRGDAAPSAQIKLKINGVIDPKPEPTDDAGKWVSFVQDLKYETTYQFIAVADYGDNAESNPWTITIEAEAIVPILDKVTDPDGHIIGGGGTTLDTRLTFTGQAKPLGTVEILNGASKLGEAIADGTGKFEKVILGLPETTYDIIIRALYSDNPESTQPWKFTIEQAVRPTIRRIYDTAGDIPNDGYTHEKSVFITGEAHPLRKVEIRDGSTRLDEAQVNGGGIFHSTLSGLSLKTYELGIKPLYGSDLPQSAIHRFTVTEKSILTIESVTDRRGTPIPNFGQVSQDEVITFHGYGAPPNSQVNLHRDNTWAGRHDADAGGKFHVNTGSHAPGGPYRFQLRSTDGQNSQDWFISITLT